MLEDMLALLAKPDRYVCIWRDGEVHIEVPHRRALTHDVRRSEHAARGVAISGDELTA